MNSGMQKKIAGFSLLIFFAASIYFYLNQSVIETHHLEYALHSGQDAFGRNCIKITLSSALESFFVILPVAGFCLLLTLMTSSLLMIKNTRLQFVLRTFLDTLTSLPGFLIALSLSALFSHASWAFFLAAVLLVYPGQTRFFESQILKLQTEDFILASSALGGTSLHQFKKHYLPELSRLLISILPFIFMRLLVIETSLTFLGLGSAPVHETWGRLLAQGKDYFLEAPWILCIASVPLFLTLFSFHLLSRTDQN